jgi:ribosomal protein S18 acetylase RimI-like enzyme
MRETRRLPEEVAIRRATPFDVDFVRQVAVEVFSYIGDYGAILPKWLLHEGVISHVAEAMARPLGFTMIGFYPAEPDRSPSEERYVADLLAIAVAREAQGRGVGKALLGHAIEQVSAMRARLPVREIRLSVEEGNRRGRRLFEAYGFRLVPGDHGRYDRGQVALHMTRTV